MKRLSILLFTLGVFVGNAYAHDGMQHVMGTVTAITDTLISVKAVDGTTESVALTSETRYSRTDATITLKDIKIGDHVVIHATKTGDQLIAAEVRVGTMTLNKKAGDMGNMKMNENSGTAPSR